MQLKLHDGLQLWENAAMVDHMLRVLLVEDNPMEIAFFEALFKTRRCAEIDCTQVDGVLECIALLQQQSFSLALVSVSLNASGEIQAIEDLFKAYPDLPLVALVDRNTKHLASVAIRAGAVDFLNKSELTPEALAKALEQYRSKTPSLAGSASGSSAILNALFQTSPPLAGKKTVLIVEDEPHIRSMYCSFLQDAGLEVLEAENGRVALQVSEAHVGRIDLILTDIIMPEMKGHVLAERMTGLRPETKVILMSGYAFDTLEIGRLPVNVVERIEKPITPFRLLKKILTALNADPSASPLQQSAWI